jgi:hypothetical protein
MNEVEKNQTFMLRMGISHRIMMGFMPVLIIMILMGLIGFYTLKSMDRDLRGLLDQNTAQSGYAAQDVKDAVDRALFKLERTQKWILMFMVLAVCITIPFVLRIIRKVSNDLEDFQPPDSPEP